MEQAWQERQTVTNEDDWPRQTHRAGLSGSWRIGSSHDFEDLIDDRRRAFHRAPADVPKSADPIDELVARLIEPSGNGAALSAWAARAAPDMISIFAPAARRLGDMWVEDECSFCDVTIGMHRLTLLLIEFEMQHPAGVGSGERGRALIASAPGDQHGFGTALVGLFLRRAGWDVTADLRTANEIVDALEAHPFDLAGFSVGHEREIEPVAALLRLVRDRSCNRHIRLAVGGPMIVGNGERARAMGADLWADDAETLIAKLGAVALEAV